MTLDSSKNECRGTPESWLDDHGDVMFRFAMQRLNDEHLAEDLVQEAFVKAIKSINQFRGESAVQTWLIQILKNEILQHFRRSRKSQSNHDFPDQEDEAPRKISELLHSQIHTHDFKTHIERQEFWTIFNRCMDKLPDHFAMAFRIRIANPDDDIEDLSQSIGIKRSNFSVRIFRSRLLLRSCLEKLWMEGGDER